MLINLPLHLPLAPAPAPAFAWLADVGGVADFGPVDTERMARQPDTRDIPARVP